MNRTNFNKITVRVGGYVKENWGAPLIIGFTLLLVGAAVSLSAGLSSLANVVVVYAYYALVAGVILQLASFVKQQKRDGEGV